MIGISSIDIIKNTERGAKTKLVDVIERVGKLKWS